MADKRILAFDGTNLTASRWQKGQVLTDQVFTADDLGYESFQPILPARNKPCFICWLMSEKKDFSLRPFPPCKAVIAPL